MERDNTKCTENEFDGKGFSDDEQVWVCDCGCVTFYLTAGGQAVCAKCKCDVAGMACRVA